MPPVIDKTNFSMKAGWTPDNMMLSAGSEMTVPRYVDSNGRWFGLFMGIDNYTTNNSDLCGVPPEFTAKVSFTNYVRILYFYTFYENNVAVNVSSNI